MSEIESKDKAAIAIASEQQAAKRLADKLLEKISVRIRRQLPDLTNITVVETPSPTSSMLLNMSNIPIVQETNTSTNQIGKADKCPKLTELQQTEHLGEGSRQYYLHKVLYNEMISKISSEVPQKRLECQR